MIKTFLQILLESNALGWVYVRRNNRPVTDFSLADWEIHKHRFSSPDYQFLIEDGDRTLSQFHAPDRRELKDFETIENLYTRVKTDGKSMPKSKPSLLQNLKNLFK